MSRRKRVLTLITATTLTVGLAALAPKALARTRVQEPAHAVKAEYDNFEVREYSSRIVAEVTVKGNAKAASNAGFRILADFIFGNNEARDSIAMTAPVDRKPVSEEIAMTAPVDRRPSATPDTWVITFTMPAKYTLETLPKPRDSRVKIREVPAKTYAVRRFSGSPSEAAVQSKIDRFVEAVDAAGLTRGSAAPSYARYDPPWTPGFLRRNEVFIELAP